MPGRLVMDQDAVQGHDALKKDSIQPTTQPNGSTYPPLMTNGVGHSGFANRNGATSTSPVDTASSQFNVGKLKDAMPAQDPLPPELEHWAHTYVPMGQLLERVAQQCYSDLTETIEAMADIPVQQAPPATNGAGSHSPSNNPPDSSSGSVEKKLRLMNFAQEHKDRFIKALVLSDWARNMDDMDKLIELRMWLQQQDDASTLVAEAIVGLKNNMIPAKMPNPNIQGALELLSTGKAPWMPDMGYVPPKPLNARQLLKTLKDMNFALSIRLNLDEELPKHFRTYSIANGRVTFVVANEFEVDLAVIDEDPQTPFYFIDLRFLFSASPQISDGVVRQNIEGKLNEVLAVDGLAGCYDYLHNLVLTHRTNTFRRQAFEMVRGKWSDCIRIESIHRDFVVQYWTGQLAGKNWIHIGTLSSNRSVAIPSKASQHPRLGIRWVREGQDCPDIDIDMRDPQCSMEQLLEQVIANHIRWRLTNIADRLRDLSGPKSALRVELKRGQQNSPAYNLEMQFGNSRAPLTLRISPVTGNFSISPASPITLDVVRRLNSEATPDAGQLIAALHCKLLQDQIRKHAQRTGWVPTPVGKQDDLGRLFGNDILRWSVFVPKNWSSQWAMAVTFSMSGEKWWVVEIDVNPTTSIRSIRSAEFIPLDTTPSPLRRATLMDIESKSVAQISFSNITKQLRQRGVQHELRHAQAVSPSSSLRSKPNTVVLCMNFNDLMRPKNPNLATTWKAWCQETVVLTHHGMSGQLSENTSQVTYVLKASLTKRASSSLAHSKVALDEDENADISFSKSGTCALRLLTNFGEGLVDQIEARLKRVEQLINYVRVARQGKVQLTHTSVSSLAFRYHSEPQLSAELHFADKTDTAVQLVLKAGEEGGQFAVDANPHRRILPLLQKLLQPADALESDQDETQAYRRFQFLLKVLKCTLPLLQGFSNLEEKDVSKISVRGSAHAFNHHRLIYTEPYPNTVIDFMLQKKNGRDIWLVTIPRDKQVKNADVAKALRRLWSSKGDGWSGLTTGAVAEISGIESLLDRLDAAVRESVPTEAVQSGGDGSSGGISGGSDGGSKANVNGSEVVVLD